MDESIDLNIVEQSTVVLMRSELQKNVPDSCRKSVRSTNQKLFSCNRCDKSYSTVASLYQHRHQKHEIQTKPSFMCSECDESFKTYSRICVHYNKDHPSIKIAEEFLTFPTKSAFHEWKEDMERNSVSKFVAGKGSHSKVKKGSKVYEYFTCHRSGVHDRQAKHSARAMKHNGSIKTGKFCPARITTTTTSEPDGQLEVKFCSTHLGHECDPGRLTLPKSERLMLAAQLMLGVSKEKVLEDARAKSSPTKRLPIVSRKDLHNISAAFGVKRDVIFDYNDAVSVDVWVQRCRLMPDNPVLLYKPQGEVIQDKPCLRQDDFFLAIMNGAQEAIFSRFGNDILLIDSTHVTNKYNVNLTSIVICDDNFERFPVAFLFSNRQTKEILVEFFLAIKEKMVVVPKPRTLMSDDAPAYSDAWKEVFGAVEYHLLCDWHVKQAWSQNIGKIRVKEKQEMVLRKLYTLQSERDEAAFSIFMREFISFFKFDPDIEAFGKYFEARYADRPKLWAACYRKGARLNTNMMFECWHSDLKCFSDLIGKHGHQLDNAIHSLMKSLRKTIIGRFASLQHGKLPDEMVDICQRHSASLELQIESIQHESTNKWSVRSSTATELYEVSKGENECSCSLKCGPCNACIHNFECSCHDFQISYNMCKHIHLVCRAIGHHVQQSEAYESVDFIISSIGSDMVLEVDALDDELQNEVDKKSIIETKANLVDNIMSLARRAKLCETHHEIDTLNEAVNIAHARLDAMGSA